MRANRQTAIINNNLRKDATAPSLFRQRFIVNNDFTFAARPAHSELSGDTGTAPAPPDLATPRDQRQRLENRHDGVAAVAEIQRLPWSAKLRPVVIWRRRYNDAGCP